MQKYKIVASKWQKKYTLILSGESESDAREKIHKEGYSILTVQEIAESEIQGNKFRFQIQSQGEIKNGIIVGDDIFKVYKKLRGDLGYTVISLFPDGDEAENDAEKREKIMEQLLRGYNLQSAKQELKEKISEAWNESFYMKKRLDETYILIEKVITKIENLISKRQEFQIDDVMLEKLETIYQRLTVVKKSANLAKLQEIGELALSKIAEIELKSIESGKNEDAEKLLHQTNDLLKKLGSDKRFVEESKDIKKITQGFVHDIKESLSFFSQKKDRQKKKGESLDKESYSFLKTVLLLEKYNQKLQENKREQKANLSLFLNPFNHSEKKEKILLRRKVIKQNITILQAKKNGTVSSYTSLKKGYKKLLENFFMLIRYIWKIGLFWIALFFLMIVWFFSFAKNALENAHFNFHGLSTFLFLFLLFFFFSKTRNFISLAGSVVILMLFYIVIGVNF